MVRLRKNRHVTITIIRCCRLCPINHHQTGTFGPSPTVNSNIIRTIGNHRRRIVYHGNIKRAGTLVFFAILKDISYQSCRAFIKKTSGSVTSTIITKSSPAIINSRRFCPAYRLRTTCRVATRCQKSNIIRTAVNHRSSIIHYRHGKRTGYLIVGSIFKNVRYGSYSFGERCTRSMTPALIR